MVSSSVKVARWFVCGVIDIKISLRPSVKIQVTVYIVPYDGLFMFGRVIVGLALSPGTDGAYTYQIGTSTKLLKSILPVPIGSRFLHRGRIVGINKDNFNILNGTNPRFF
jgi:hypothetical protein